MRGPAAIRAAAFLLGAGCVVWATVPQVHKGVADWALFLAIVGVAAGALRLALTAVPVPKTPTCCRRGCASGSASWRPSGRCPGRKAR